MTDVKLTSRLANLWRGFLSLWIADLEKANPEIAYENAISGMVARYAGLKKATAGIIRRREDIEQRLARHTQELAQTQQDLNTAVETGQDDLGVTLIQKKNQLETEVAQLQVELRGASGDADDAKASLLQVQAEIKRIKAEKDVMLAKMQSAQARIRIQEQLDGLSVEADVKALDTVREHINTLAAQAKLGAELQDASLDQRLTKLRAQSGESQAKQQLDQLKAVAAAKKGQTQRSM